MKMRSFLLEAGTIIAWKKYPYIKKLWNKIRGKQLPFNMFTIVPSRTELLTSDDMKDIEIYEPIRKYNKQEQSKISTLAKDTLYSSDWVDVASLINIVRPNTLLGSITLATCKYYKKVEWNEKLDEYIY
jgi:hypothetical protein